MITNVYRLSLIGFLLIFTMHSASEEDISAVMIEQFLEHQKTASLLDHCKQIEDGSLGDTYGNKVSMLFRSQYDSDIHDLGKIFITTLENTRNNLTHFTTESLEIAQIEIITGAIENLRKTILYLYDTLLPLYKQVGWAS